MRFFLSMELEQHILNACHNGTHSAKIADLLKSTGATRQELWEAIKALPVPWRIGENINGAKLLIIVNQ